MSGVAERPPPAYSAVSHAGRTPLSGAGTRQVTARCDPDVVRRPPPAGRQPRPGPLTFGKSTPPATIGVAQRVATQPQSSWLAGPVSRSFLSRCRVAITELSLQAFGWLICDIMVALSTELCS